VYKKKIELDDTNVVVKYKSTDYKNIINGLFFIFLLLLIINFIKLYKKN